MPKLIRSKLDKSASNVMSALTITPDLTMMLYN